jgi:hypothetical protein
MPRPDEEPPPADDPGGRRKELKSEFSWSHSRAKLFRNCKRQYYYQYYGSWGGWDRGNPAVSDEAKETYLLKQLITLDMAVGKVIDKGVDFTLDQLKRGRRLSKDEVIQKGRSDFIQHWNDSKQELWRSGPTQYFRLFEHHYGIEIPKERLKDVEQKIITCLSNFMTSEIFGYCEELLEASKRDKETGWLDKRILKGEDFQPTFSQNAVKVYAQIDFSAKRHGEIMLFDWKTGWPRNDDLEQLDVYALYAVRQLNVPLDKVLVIPVYLQMGAQWRASSVPRERISALESYIDRTAQEMLSYLDDREANTATKSNFGFTDNLRECRMCKFKALCPGAKRLEGEEAKDPFDD